MCEREVHGEQSITCDHCRAVSYCSALCQKQHWKETHKTLCGLYKGMMEREEELECGAGSAVVFPIALLVCFLLKVDFGILGVGLMMMSIQLIQLLSPILLSGWLEYYILRSLPVSSPVSNIFSHPLTLNYILTSLSISTNYKEPFTQWQRGGSSLSLDRRGIGLDACFAEIGYLLKGTGNIQIVMVGPGVLMNLSGTTLGISSRVRVNLVRGLYQEEATCHSSPHVVVGLNCRLENYESWVGGLHLIKAMGVSAFFTDQSEISCPNAKQVPQSAGQHVTQPLPNPFRSPSSNRGTCNNLPSYSSGFLFGVNT
ncbi:hypothetical protein RHGRI_037271 [Rhododendron griersonianum]|uniref:MYND-type domain-containing protein n=1 Tax=Rhododendron griersonianum TaxID=479676 RepID=A0AAV6HUC0_9ERIC|nr:hypothetical protein RHGRI_037271 [Rhododendron griersonianum]